VANLCYAWRLIFWILHKQNLVLRWRIIVLVCDNNVKNGSTGVFDPLPCRDINGRKVLGAFGQGWSLNSVSAPSAG